MTEVHYQILKKVLEGQVQLPQTEWQKAKKYFQPLFFEKNRHLVWMEQKGEYLFFIASGLVRLYYTTPEAKDYNKSFAWEGMFITGTLDIKLDAKSDFAIQALENTKTLAIPLSAFLTLLKDHPVWGELRSSYLAWLAERKARREKQLLLESAEQRLRIFLKDFAAIADRIPQYHIASYLGITDVALSRIKKRMKTSGGSSGG